MKSKNIRLKARLLFLFCCLSWLVVAQSNGNNNTNTLSGKWIFEDAFIADPESPVSFDLYNDYFQFYAEIEIGEDRISLTNDEGVLTAEYVIDGNYLGIDLPSGEPFVAKWKRQYNQLLLEFDGFHPYDESKKVKVSVVYRQE